MKKFALLGFPISQSLSPVLFGAAYPSGTEGTYSLVEEKSFDTAYDIFIREYDGVNVTSPFKMEAAARADLTSREVSLCGAANLLMKRDGGAERSGGLIEAFNTDFLAVRDILLEAFPSTGGDFRADGPENFGAGRTAVVVGAGGAGKCAAAALRECGFSVTMLNRTACKADAGLDVLPQVLEGCQVLIYTLPCPISELESLNLSLHSPKLIIESSYIHPSLGRMAAEAGIPYRGGLEWLLRQAIHGYRILTGKEPDAEKMKNILTLREHSSLESL